MGKKDDKRDSKSHHSDDIKDEQKLQAILLADSFEKNFRPITLERPKVLLPLASNIPMLEYTIEFLAQNGVEELFVFCVWLADVLQDYISKSKWPSTISVKCITSTACTSAGDALRELDSIGVIRSDPFILISGDVISNMDLRKAIKFHRERRKFDPNAIMTVALKTVKSGAGARSLFDDLFTATDSYTSQLLLFEDSYSKDSIGIPCQILDDHANILFRNDLLDCHVDICSPELMLQFSDNFDYQDIRRDFIRNEVLNWELGMHIYSYIIENEYAARVHDPRTYHSISRDIITRWVFPLVPDSEFVPGTCYVHNKNYNYKGKDTKVSRTAIIGECNVIGNSCSIGDNSCIHKTTIGSNCIIGDNVTITESHIWDNCFIESGAVINGAIICNDVTVRKGATVTRGCILSFGITIDELMSLPENTRVSLYENELHLDMRDNQSYDHAIVGKNGKGFVWKQSVDDVEQLEFMNLSEFNIADLTRGHSIGCYDMEQWKLKRWENVPQPQEDGADSEIYSFDDENSDINAKNNELSSADSFENVIDDMITSGHAEGNPADNILMEIKGYKFTQNKTFCDCIRAVTGPLLRTCVTGAGMKQNDLLLKLSSSLKPGGWSFYILQALLQDTDEETVLIHSIEEFVLNFENSILFYPIFRHILQILYDAELLSDESLKEWIIHRRRGDQSGSKAVLFNEKCVQTFVEWIEADDDDDDDEEED